MDDSSWSRNILCRKFTFQSIFLYIFIIFIEQYLANPGRWCNIWDQLSCLTPTQNLESWLSNEIMESYIFHQFKVPLFNQKMVYIPIDIIQSLQSNKYRLNKHIKAYFQKVLRIQRIDPSVQQATFLLRQNANHWFVVVFDWERQTAWTFNRHPLSTSVHDPAQESTEQWTDWNGRNLWDNIEILLNWNVHNAVSSAHPKKFLQAKSLRWHGVRILI